MILEESVLYLFRGVVINFYTLFGGWGNGSQRMVRGKREDMDGETGRGEGARSAA